MSGTRHFGMTLGSSLAALYLAACHAASPAAPVEAPSEEPPPPPLAALTPEEAGVRAALEREVAELTAIGPRNVGHSWNLATATDHIALRLEKRGYTVQRQGFMVGEELTQNLEVELMGAESGNELVVIATHYDTVQESPGANASATGAAALLVLAERFAGKRFDRAVRLVWLSNEASAGAGATAGSRVYVDELTKSARPVVATITLGSLGYYSLRPGSQRYPEELLYGADSRPRFGNFLALVANPSSNALLERTKSVLGHASLPVEELILPDSAPLAADGAQARFWQKGLPAVALTDTAKFRDPDHASVRDTPDKVDFDRFARVVVALEELVTELAER